MSELADMRESLEYWERRASRLPRRAVRRRREARMAAARWRARLAEAERSAYGPGLLGLLALMVAERRLPVTARHGARQVARRGAQAAALLALTCAAVVVLAVVAVAQFVSAVL